MMKYIVIFIVLCVSTVASICEQAANDHRYFAVTQDDEKHLTYLEFRNEFGYSSSVYMFGEVSMNSSAGLVRLELKEWNTTAKIIQGDANQGVALNLRNQAQTETFIIPNSPTTISYLNFLNTRRQCRPHSNNDVDILDHSRFPG